MSDPYTYNVASVEELRKLVDYLDPPALKAAIMQRLDQHPREGVSNLAYQFLQDVCGDAARASGKVASYFDVDGSPKKCTKCDCNKFTEKVLGRVDVFQGQGPTSEAEYICDGCGEVVGFWAYGSWDPEFRRGFELEEIDPSPKVKLCKVCGVKPCAPSFDHCDQPECVPL